MNKFSIIQSIINVSAQIQTSLVNYMEYHSLEPREPVARDYLRLEPRPEKREELPLPFQKEQVLQPDYTVLLQLAEERGKPIRPITRKRKSLRTNVNCCRKCHAPKEYLWNHGFYRPKGSTETYPRLTCKVCYSEYAPHALRHKPKHRCPYCGYALNPKNYRKNYTVYYCEQHECPHRSIHPLKIMYSEKEWNFDYDTLSCHFEGQNPKLQRIKIPKHILDLEMSLFVECGMSSREVVKILQKIYGPYILRSHQTVHNHARALALHISHHEKMLPLPLSDTVCEDETYLRYRGKWGYLFRALNPENRAIIQEYFSPYRDTRGCITLNKGVVEKYLQNFRDPSFRLIADRAPIYQSMQKYMHQHKKANIELFQIKGIFDAPNEENACYRPEKQTIERSFESLKSATRRRRGFSGFEGAETFCYLHKIYYNYLRSHSSLNNQPPIPLHLRSSNPVQGWAQLLQYINEKR